MVEPKILAQVSRYDTERLWKVWEKSDYWLPIQPRKKSANFVPTSQRVEISNLIGLAFLKGTLFQPKTAAGVSSGDTEGSWQVLGKTYP